MDEQTLSKLDQVFSKIENLNFDIQRLTEEKSKLDPILQEALGNGYLPPLERINQERIKNQEVKKNKKGAKA